jgi:hypothetical protein
MYNKEAGNRYEKQSATRDSVAGRFFRWFSGISHNNAAG